jgi:hypothetical protein
MCTDGPLCQPGSECLQERETTIDNKERRINELRLKSKELEKIKFVLDYKCAVRGRVGLGRCMSAGGVGLRAKWELGRSTPQRVTQTIKQSSAAR